MIQQDLKHYIEQLEMLRELESKNLLRSEVIIKYQDIITAQILGVRNKDSIDTPLSEEIGNTFTESSSSHKPIFISYCHKDRKWLDKLHTVLTPLIRQERIHIWTDTHIKPGENWQEEIEKALTSAKIAVLLVTPHFLASDFIAKHEFCHLLKAAQHKGLRILWIAVSASLYAETEIGGYQAINDPARPLDTFKSSALNKELVRVCKQIKEITGIDVG